MNYLIPVLLLYFVCSFGPQARAEDNDPKVEENRELLLEKIKDDLVILDELTKDYAKEKSEDLKIKIDETVDGIQKSLNSLKSDAKSEAGELTEKIKNDVIRLKREVKPFIEDVNQKASDIVNEGIKEIGGALNNLKNKMKEMKKQRDLKTNPQKEDEIKLRKT